MDTGPQLVQAMLFGKLDGLRPETIFLYSRTGLIHLFSASGFHMAAALGTASLFSRGLEPWVPARHRKYLLFALSLALMIFFGRKTEWSSPLVRSFAFTTLLLAAKLLEARPSKLRVFFLSLAAAYAFGRGSNLSFLLSACGMAGVLWGGGKNIFTLALGPWLFTLPIVIWNFGLFSLSAPFWNLTYGVAVGATVLPLAVVDLLLSSLGVPWRGLFELAAMLMEFFHGLLVKCDFDFSYWVEPRAFSLLSLLLFGASYFGARMWMLGALAALALFLPAPKLVALDVGQGDGIFLRAPGGNSLLVDGGPPGWFGASRPLEKLALGALDDVLLTHPDRDHLGGLPALLGRHQAKRLWLRAEHLADPRLLPLLSAAERAGTEIHFLTPIRSPAGLRCWLPPTTQGNESSPFCHANLEGGKSVWLTGDSGKISEEWLLSQVAIPRADFVKLGHHGSKYSSTEDFLRATGASVAVVSAGAKNRYGHPAPEVLARLKKLGLELRRTDQEGSLRFY